MRVQESEKSNNDTTFRETINDECDFLFYFSNSAKNDKNAVYND